MGCKRIRTTAYHPASNGLVERFHRQLKVALLAAPETPWPEVIPLALLGIRSTFKPDIGCSVAEMVYGTSLRLPGDLICPLPGSTALSPADYVSRLRRTMAALRPATSRPSRVSSAFQHPDLASCTHVFVRCDAVRKPLQSRFSGLLNVLAPKARMVSSSPSPVIMYSTQARSSSLQRRAFVSLS
ncbi:uncharacterized protein LOC135394775 [Ornithodoros turicata]|uniref:uncharacterized protein LOC135394775 n=1 Tax=Ornithodoros turicata TaxID=34597 RepID=UPI00313A2A64